MAELAKLMSPEFIFCINVRLNKMHLPSLNSELYNESVYWVVMLIKGQQFYPIVQQYEFRGSHKAFFFFLC